MQVMSEAGQLLLAGPMGDPQLRAGQRGIYVFDEADVQRALEYAHTDPAFRAGIFEMVAPFWSTTMLAEVPAAGDTQH